MGNSSDKNRDRGNTVHRRRGQPGQQGGQPGQKDRPGQQNQPDPQQKQQGGATDTGRQQRQADDEGGNAQTIPTRDR